jgi:putative DNA primase/helicase
MRRLPIHRGPSGLVLLVADRVVAIPSSEFVEAVRAEWVATYSDESLARGTIARAFETIRVDRSFPTTDRRPPPPAESDDCRPTIAIDTDLERMANETIGALSGDGRTYQRSGELVHVTRAPEPKKDQPIKKDHAPLAEGSPVIRTLSLPTLRERTASRVRWVKLNSEGEPRLTLPPAEVTSAVHSRGQWTGLPPLEGIAEAPFMRPDGSLVQCPGYDAATGFLYAPNATFPLVPERPSREQAAAALAMLVDLYVDFPFVDEASRMVPIATQLAIQVRPAIEGPIPGMGYDAATKGTGKTKAAAAAVTIATGRPPSPATFPGGRNGQEELEKMLGAYALAGAPVVFFDNVPIGVPFGGAPLEKVLTAPGRVSLRRLGASETPELPWNAQVIATGNNITIADETARRVFVARMVSDLERPEERTGFKYDLDQHVRENRPALVAAGLTIVRAYVAAGRPDTGTIELGSFEAWSRLIPRAIVWAGGADIMGARVVERGDGDDDAAVLASILGHLPRLVDGNASGLTTAAILDALYPAPRPDEPPDGWEELRRALESASETKPGTRPDARRLGTYLAGQRDKTISMGDGRRARLVILSTKANAKRWGVR